MFVNYQISTTAKLNPFLCLKLDSLMPTFNLPDKHSSLFNYFSNE